MRAPCLGLGLVLVLAACGGGGNPDQFDAAPPDSDPSCGEWTVAPTAGSNLRLYDPAASIGLGRTIRIAYDLALTACEQPASGTITYTGGETTGEITPRVLRQIGGTCVGTAHTFTRVLDFVPPLAGTWTVTLAGADDVSFTVDPEPTPACDPLRTPCETDCDCDTAVGERCIGVDQGGPTTVCARLCELDRDCGGDGRCTGDAPGGVPYVCDTQPECDGGAPCPVGFTCAGGACSPTFTLSQTTRHECSCDADCDTGLRCVRPYDASEPNRCQAMCLTDGLWCEGPHFCGDLGTDVSGLAGTDAVCGWVGD